MSKTHDFSPFELEAISLPESFGAGYQGRVYFDNGYGASVIQHMYSYGGPEGHYELAVLKDNKLCYDTPITNDVKGWLSASDVVGLLQQIKAL